MTQTCNDGSGCPFVQGRPGGASYDQINARFFSSYGPTVEGQSLEEFVDMMRRGAGEFHSLMGGQRPWRGEQLGGGELTNVYMVYNDADPWTAPGVAPQSIPAGRNISYDLGGGGVAHCVYPAPAAQASIREWARVADPPPLPPTRKPQL